MTDSRPASYAERRKERIDELAAASVDETPGVSLIASAWRRLRRDPVFLLGPRHHRRLRRAGDHLAVDRAARPGRRTAARQGPPADQPGPRTGAGLPAGRATTAAATCCRGCSSGSRQTLIVGVLATLFGLIGGLVLGILAGAFGGWVDSVVMRIVDVMLSIPSLLLAFTIAALASRPSQTTLIIAIADHPGPDLRPAAARLDARAARQRPRAGRPGPRGQAARRSSSATCCPTRSAR